MSSADVTGWGRLSSELTYNTAVDSILDKHPVTANAGNRSHSLWGHFTIGPSSSRLPVPTSRAQRDA